MPRFVCIECFDFVEQCGHTDRENMYPAEPVKKEKIETAQNPLKSKIYIADILPPKGISIVVLLNWLSLALL
jgi:hypothetical protein